MTIKEKAEHLHKKVGTFIITCVGADGYPLTKAVIPGKIRDSIKEIFFCTNTSSKFAHEISRNPKSSVYFFSKILLSWKGCMLKGNMEIVLDIELKRKYWQNLYKDAYPEKLFTDPDFCLLKFSTISGRFYSNFKIEDFVV